MNQGQRSIELTPRQPGRHYSRTSRRGGQIPVVVYGPKTKPINGLVEIIPLTKLLGQGMESRILVTKSSEKSLDGISVLVRDVQVHPLTRIPIHLDLFALDMTADVRVSVQIRLEGKAIGLTEGGMLEQIMRELEIECRPNAIPDMIVADVSGLHVGNALHVSDLIIPEGVKVLSASNLTVATCAVLKEEAATPVAVAAATPEAAAASGAASAPGAAPAAAKPAAAKADEKKK